MIGRTPYFNCIVILIEIFVEEMVFLPEFMGCYFCEISLYCRERVDFSSTGLVIGEDNQQEGNKNTIKFHRYNINAENK